MNAFILARKSGASVARAKRIAGNAVLKASMVAAAAVSPLLSFAADDANTTKINDAGTKIEGYAVTVVGIMITFWAAKRAGQKMGWW
jgi:hypothetical protein